MSCKNLSFARNRLNALLLAQGFGFVGALVPRLTDLFVSGNVVGVDALAAIAAIMPVTIGALFVGKLVYCGSGYLFSRYQGEFRRDRAREVVGMSLQLAALAGVSIWTAMFFGRDPYFDYMRLTLLEQFVLTALCSVALCGLWGVDVLWIGMPLGVVLSLLAIAAFCWLRDGTAIPEPAFEKGNAILNVSFRPAPERIVGMRNEVEAFLAAHGVSRETVGRIALLAEECAMALVDRHGGRSKRIVAETSITVGKGCVQVIFRDTGDMGDLTDGDAPVSSLRTFVIAGLVRVIQSRQYLNMIGCNRAMFTFA